MPEPKARASRITSGAVAGIIYRAVRGLPIPVLAPDQTWWQIRPSANVDAVAVAGRLDFRPPGEVGDMLYLALDGLYGAIHAQTGFPVRAQWALLTSAIGHWLLEIVPDNHARAISLAESMFASDALLNAVKPRVTWLEVAGEPRAFTTRRVCCFNYLGNSGAHCTSQCPILPREERIAYAREQLTRKRQSA